MSVVLRLMTPKDFPEVAKLIYESLNTWYLKNRGFRLVTGSWETMLVFPEVYESLDPNSCVVAEDTENRRLAGSCFFHVRPTHVSLGIMNVHPDYFSRKTGSRLLSYIIKIADEHQLPLRLVSSAMNLDSFSLYNRQGFRPVLVFQDMTMTVPESGVSVPLPHGTAIRPATFTDIPELTALEQELYSINREKDFRFFLKNERNIWKLSVLYQEQTGKIDGFVVSVCDPGSHMIGPGIARTEEQMAALICHQLNYYPGRQPVWLIPTDALRLRRIMFETGARNCEIHFGQVRGNYKPPTGIVLPSFMPETS